MIDRAGTISKRPHKASTYNRDAGVRERLRSEGAPRLTFTSGPKLAELPQLSNAAPQLRRDIRVVANVLPFRVNQFLIDETIDWSAVPDDPMYRLLFPHRDMLPPEDFERMAKLLDLGASKQEIQAAANDIRWKLNPHPAGQLEKNVPTVNGRKLTGLQHKYRETVLVFPSQGQTCFAYCSYCFRWAQFVGISELKQAAREAGDMVDYLKTQPHVTDVLITGGEPFVMSPEVLRRYIEPLWSELPQITSVRIGTKVLSFWPHRFTTDPDADEYLRIIDEANRKGLNVAFMAHVSHPRQIEHPEVELAVRRLRRAGAVIRTQSPVIRHVNDDADTWARNWKQQVALGMVPYYMFIERDTGAHRYFELPLAEVYEIYRNAITQLSGLARSARGPSMSATPGKVTVDGISEIAGERVFNLRFLQARNPAWANRPFYARYDDDAVWLDHLKPAFGEDKFFFENDEIQDWRDVQ